MNSRSRPIDRRSLLGLGGAIPAGLMLLSTGALADDRQFVTQVANEALAVARSGGSPAKFKAILMRYASVQGVAMFALGRYRAQLPAAQKSQYVALATNYIAGMFSRYSKSFAGDRFVATNVDEGIVKGRILFANGQTSNVDWRVSGGKIVDVNIQGAWLSLQLRDQFTRALSSHNGDFEALFRFLQTGRQ